MNYRNVLVVVPIAAALVIGACSSDSGSLPSQTTTASQSTTTPVGAGTQATVVTSAQASDAIAAALAANQDSHAQADDIEYNDSAVTEITLNGGSASVSGSGASVSGSKVSIIEAGTYRFKGTLTDGQVVVNSTGNGKVRIVLDGASITSTTGSALNIVEADEVVVVLAPSSQNQITDGSYTVADNDSDAPNAALYSMADLAIGGEGALTVTGNSYDGITSKDGLVILGGKITVKAKDDGIHGKDYVIVEGGDIDVTAGGDGLRSDNDSEAERGYVAVMAGNVTIAAADGVDAATDVLVNNGKLSITNAPGISTADGTSAKGLKAGVLLVIGGGDVTIDTADDALHSDGDILISDGMIKLATADDGIHAENTLTVIGGATTIAKSYEGLEASQMTLSGGTIDLTSTDDGINLVQPGTATTGPGFGGGMGGGNNNVTLSGAIVTVNANGDGVDANGAMTMTAGTLIVSGPTAQNNGALDADRGITMSGGVLVAAGSSGMAVAPSTASAQGWVSVTFTQPVAAGTQVQIVDGDTVIASYKTAKATASLIFSSSEIVTGKTYDVYTGGAAGGDVLAGYSAGGSLAGATKVQTVTAGQHTGGGFGGGPGGGFGGRVQ